MKVTIGLIYAHGFPVPVPFVTAWTRMLQAMLTGQAGLEMPGERVTAIRVLESYAFPIDVARNELIRAWLDKDDAEAFVFLDADMVHPPDLVSRLLRHRQPLVSGRYQMRKAPHWTVAMRKVGPGPRDYKCIDKLMTQAEIRGLLPIDAAGAGALLIRREVALAIRDRIGDRWFAYAEDDAGLMSVSEDMHFFAQAQAAGYQPWLDADTVARHVATMEIGPEWHAPYAEALAAAREVTA